MPKRPATMDELKARFWQRVNKNGPVHPVCGQCWMWTGNRMKIGYGKLTTLERVVTRGLAHRFSWHIHNGPIPAGLSVLHRCDNRACVNPKHLFLGTQQDNLADMRAKGHQVRGERQGNAKTTEEVVREMRRRYVPYSRGPNGIRALSKEFGVRLGQTARILRGSCWRHVK